MSSYVDGIWNNIFRRDKGPKSDRELLETLRKVPVFSDLNSRELEQVLRIAHRREYEEGEDIVREGQPSAGMYVILEGSARVSRRSPQGIRIDIAQMEEGDFFGDIGLLDNAPRTATVTANTECLVLGFFRPELVDLMERDPRLACKILWKLAQVIAARLRFTDIQLAKFAELASQADETTQTS